MFLKSNVCEFAKILSSRILRCCFQGAFWAVMMMNPMDASVHAVESASLFSLTDARETSVNGSGNAKGIVTPTYDEAARKDVLELDFSVAQDETVEVFAKDFPSGITPETISAVKIGVKDVSGGQAKQIDVSVKVHGALEDQIFPISLRPIGWSSFQESIEWDRIGSLESISFVLSLVDGQKKVDGTIQLSLDFFKPVLPVVKPTAPAIQQINAAADQETSIDKQLTSVVEDAVTNKPVLTPVGPLSSFNFLNANETGTTSEGEAKGTVVATFDEAAGKDVLELDYTIQQGDRLLAWAKGFPSELGPEGVNAVRVGFRVPEVRQAKEVALKLLLVGTLGQQSMELKVRSGWNSFQEIIDWEKIGTLNEVAFQVIPAQGVAGIKGTLDFALEFAKTDPSKVIAVPGGNQFSVFSILDAGARGMFNIGNAKGNVASTFDEALKRDVIKFEYSIPKGTVAGVWTKEYPEELQPKAADAVRIGVFVSDADAAKQISLKVEVKGEQSLQPIPLKLQPGWNFFQESINWSLIGNLTEVVFVAVPSVGDRDVSGTLFLDLGFGQLTFLQKNFTFIKVLLVLCVGFFGLLLAGFFGGWAAKNKNPEGVSTASGVKRDFVYGLFTVVMAGVAMRIYSLGMMGPLEVDFGFLAVGLMGAVLAAILKLNVTGKPLTPGEVFQNIVLTGLLATASSGMELLQPPASWSQLFMVSKTTAALTFIIYHVANACSISSSGKHISPVQGGLIVGTPFLFGWLLFLENASFLQSLGTGISLGLLGAWPAVTEVLGRVLVVFLFNEAVTNGISLATKGRTLQDPKAHRFIFLISLGVVLSPVVAFWGSTSSVAALPVLIQAVIAVVTVMLSFGGFWGEVYLITGMLIDSIRLKAPTEQTISSHTMTGLRKGAAFSGILMAILYALHIVLGFSAAQSVMKAAPLLVGILAGAVVFPLIKTVIETFDGSQPFFDRMRYSYRNVFLYVRGAVVGFGFAFTVSQGLFQKEMSERMVFGVLIGLVASLGVSLLRDAIYAFQGRGKIQTWKLYFVDSVLGVFVGSAAAFYLDALQVPVIIEKFKLYTSSGFPAVDYVTYPLLNKWGRIDLGSYTGGAKLLFIESLAGVINWSIAAWLFAINKVFMQAYFEKDTTPIKFFFSRAGFVELFNHMVYVLRWGLWMSPIIFTFLRMMPEPTWYNQDGAIRTLIAIFNNATMSHQAFHDWSLKVFIWVLAFDFFRILIWMDHMGLRVATLVNLSFMGMERLDEKVARFIGPAAAQRYIPEAIKRFTTWAPLLIPFYIPRGNEWDYAWNTSLAMQNARSGGLLETLQSLPIMPMVAVIAGAVLACTVVFSLIRVLRYRSDRRRLKSYELMNREYRSVLREDGAGYSEVIQKECDVSRRSYDQIDPCGRILFVVDGKKSQDVKPFWPVIGNYPTEQFSPSQIEKREDAIWVVNTDRGVKTTLEIRLPDQDSTSEIWTIRLENMTKSSKQLKVVPYLEWVLNGGLHDRFHTQYQRLYPEMEYLSDTNALLAWQKSTKAMGFVASDVAPEGFLTSRMDFIGRARSIWDARIFETMHFKEAHDAAPCPTFEPIGSLLIEASLDAGASKTIRLMMGYAKNKKAALEMIEKQLQPRGVKSTPRSASLKKVPLIGHGEILPGTPLPYSEFIDGGKKLLVKSPYTPRPFDHAMSNPLHSVMVTNRGLHTSCNGNSQQNRLTPDWSDTVTREIPSEAIYLYDVDQSEWYSPTHHPLNDYRAKNESEFGVDGTAVFRMSRDELSTELTVFVPPQDPVGIYLLTIKNHSKKTRKMRVAPYFQMVLSLQPERSGPLVTKYDKFLGALFFENPRNMFRKGPAFASMTIPVDQVETKRGRFFGTGRGVANPYMVEKGSADNGEQMDQAQIAAFLGSFEVPAQGEYTLAVLLGQTDERKQANAIVQKYKNMENVRKSLQDTRKWWLGLMGTLEIRTNQPDFDYYQNWLKYQAVAERIWARRGFYQTSGAFGFRDQLQDTVNLIWVDPSLARKQIILHASQQFIEGDVFHWFFTLTDGRTAFSCRSHASDNLLWLAWGVVEYVRMTGDESILNELTSYVVSKDPWMPLPKNKHGFGDLYQRSTRADSVYRHCMKSIDVVLEKRMGKNGLPLIGTGDWNDGLDEIGSEGKGESVWLGFFLYYILKEMLPIIQKKDGKNRGEYYENRMQHLAIALEKTWRDDRYLRAFHDDGTEIGLKGSGVWEIDALTAAWAVMSGINQERGRRVFQTALDVLEKDNAILLGWPALREDTKPYLGRSSKYPEGVRENGMYCHGVQWLVRAARILAEEADKKGDAASAEAYRETAYRLWLKVSPIPHVQGKEIELYGGQPNKQAADLLTTFDCGRMIWHGYTGAAGWMLRQAFESVIGASLVKNEMRLPPDLDKSRGALKIETLGRDLRKSPLKQTSPFSLKNDGGKVTVFPPEAVSI